MVNIENLREAMDEMFDFICDLPSGTDGFECDFDAAFGELQKVESALRWIPVTERLPEEEWERYSAEKGWDVFPCLAVVKHNNGSRYVDKLFFTGENFVDEEYVRYTAQVTRWMPLPEPPKEVE